MIATASPTAVVISASAMPAETVPMPPPPFAGSASFWNAVMMPPTVPNSPTNGADDETVASTGRPRRRPASSRSLTRSSVRRDRVGALETRVGGRLAARLVGLGGARPLLEAGANHARDRATREAGVEPDRFTQAAGGA